MALGTLRNRGPQPLAILEKLAPNRKIVALGVNMPIVHVHMLRGRSEEVKGQVASGITRVLVECTGVNVDAVRVLIHEIDAMHWFAGGIPKSTAALRSSFDDV